MVVVGTVNNNNNNNRLYEKKRTLCQKTCNKTEVRNLNKDGWAVVISEIVTFIQTTSLNSLPQVNADFQGKKGVSFQVFHNIFLRSDLNNLI